MNAPIHLARLVWLTIAIVLAACGGGGGGGGSNSSSSSTSTSSSISSVSDAVIQEQVRLVDSVSSAYTAQMLTTPDADAQALLSWMRSQPGIVDPEIIQPGVIAYNLADGTPGIADLRRRFENLPAIPRITDTDVGVAADMAAAGPRPQAQAARVLERHRVFLYDALAGKLGAQSWATITGLKSWFSSAGFIVDTTSFTTPNSLLSVRAADVLYMDAHGGIGRYEKLGGERFYAIATSVRATPENIRTFKSAIDQRQVAIYGVPELMDPASLVRGWRMLSYLAITPEFVRQNMTFTPGALVFINGCEFMTDGAEFEKMRAAFRAVGVTNLLGWNSFTEATYAAESALYLFDRLLGVNGYAPFMSDPAHRPFDLPAVMRAMAQLDRKNSNDLTGTKTYQKLDTSKLWGTWSAKLVHQTPAGELLALRPSISLSRLDNAADTLVLTGTFGAPPGVDHAVMIDGTDLTSVATWTPNTITIKPLPRNGSGSSGPVEVQIGGVRSNTTWVNAWHGVQLSQYHPMDQSDGFGDHTARTITICTVDFRAATGTFRIAPEQSPQQEAINADPTLPGTCSYRALGRYTNSLGSIDLSVVGSPDMPWLALSARQPPRPARYAWVQAQMHPGRRAMDLQMFHYIQPGEGGGPQQMLTDLNGKVTVVPPTGLDETATSANTPAIFDAQGNLQVGSHQQAGQYFTWSGARASHQEEPRAGR